MSRMGLRRILRRRWSCSKNSTKREWIIWPMCTCSMMRRGSSRFRSSRFRSPRWIVKDSTLATSNQSSTTKSSKSASTWSTRTSTKMQGSDFKTWSRCRQSCSRSQTPCSQSLTQFITFMFKSFRRISKSRSRRRTKRQSMICSASFVKRRPSSKMNKDGLLRTPSVRSCLADIKTFTRNASRNGRRRMPHVPCVDRRLNDWLKIKHYDLMIKS